MAPALAKKGQRVKGYYCVTCGEDEPRSLEVCPQSEQSLTHLLAQYGHVEDWFKVKKSVAERPK